MKKNVLGKISLIFLFIYCFSFNASAQKSEKKISNADKQALIALFKDVPSSNYLLRFNNGTEKYGKKRVSMNDLKTVSRYRDINNSAGYIVIVVEGSDVIYLVAVGSSKLKEALGGKRTRELQRIMAKYRK